MVNFLLFFFLQGILISKDTTYNVSNQKNNYIYTTLILFSRVFSRVCSVSQVHPVSESTTLKEKKHLQPSSSDDNEPAGRNGKP